jgi:hydrogenase-4 component B
MPAATPRSAACGRTKAAIRTVFTGTGLNRGAGMNIAPQLFAAFFILCASGAVAALLIPTRWNPIVLGMIGSLAAVITLVTSTVLLVGDATFRADLWSVLSLGTMSLGTDRLSALFLFVTSLVFLPVSIFSGAYLQKYLGHYSLRYFSILYHALFASIVLVLIADDAISFLVAWEMISIVSYLLVNFEYEREESSHAGFVMLAMSEAGTIAVAIAFILVAGASGTLEFGNLRLASSALSAELSLSRRIP